MSILYLLTPHVLVPLYEGLSLSSVHWLYLPPSVSAALSVHSAIKFKLRPSLVTRLTTSHSRVFLFLLQDGYGLVRHVKHSWSPWQASRMESGAIKFLLSNPVISNRLQPLS